MSYSGTYYHTMDAKNRVFIPAKFREALGESFYIFRATEKCLYLYDENAWNAVAENVIANSDTEVGRKNQRKFFRRVSSIDMDKQGRITMGNEFVDYADLKKEVVIIGMGNRIEVWSDEEWSKLDDDDTTDIASGIKY